MPVNYLSNLPDPEKEVIKCREFLEFFRDRNDNSLKYIDQLQEIANRQRKLLKIELDDILAYKDDEEFVTNIKRNTMRYIRNFENEADRLLPAPAFPVNQHDIIDVLDKQRLDALQLRAANQGTGAQATSDLPMNLKRRYEVIIIPLTSEKPRKLRDIKADDVGNLVTIKGLVTRSSDIKPKAAVCTYICEVCGCEIFQDILGNQFMPIQKCPSRRCSESKTAGKIVMQTRGSRFVKYQELRVQELPDQVPVGHIPRSMMIHCTGELTRCCSLGDVVSISGVYLTVKYSGFKAITAGLQADTYLEAFSIDRQKLSFDRLLQMGHDEEMVLEIARDIDPYSRLANSIAPEIFGHEDVKKALLLQMVGGVTRNLPDGMKIRGDINILLMGDPGVAKSQLLKYVSTIAPRGVYTTGKGSSGVGLTASVVRDTASGEMVLEGGALVLADMGICCIDEFDKMDESDRTAIHEVMEQQTVSIAKAGITTTLNARSAVLAAANPLYGRYNLKKSISENVDLPNSLLSRFDLLFLLLDHHNVEKDTALANHVLHVHKYSKPQAFAQAPLSPEAFKRYIAAARSFSPRILPELSSYVVEAYVSMRENDYAGGSRRKYKSNENNQAMMTPRQLLSILRLSQALARLRLSELVSSEDINEAIRLTVASKSSLTEDVEAGVAPEDVISQIFTIIKDLSVSMRVAVLDFIQVEATVVKKGFTSEQLRRCLSEYQSMGILSVESGQLITLHG